MNSPIAMTGAGVISALGAGGSEFERALYAGKRAARPSVLLGPEFITGEIAAFEPHRWLGEKGIRSLDRTALLVCVAMHLALSDAGLEGSADSGIICGTVFGSLHSITSFDWTGLTDGPQYVSPMEFPNTVINSPIGQAAIRFKLRGINSMLCGGEASSLYAIGQAAECLRLGRARSVLAGGVESFSEEAFLALRSTGTLSPDGSARPFASNSPGTLAGEGAAFLVLEPDRLARQRGARPWAEVVGAGAAFEPDSRSSGLVRAIHAALQQAGLEPQRISFIAASAGGNPQNDCHEATAIKDVFGTALHGIPICAPKAAFGEVLGASGVMCALTAALALQRQCAPPTPGWDRTDPDLRLSAAPQPFVGDCALVNAVGSDGNSAALILRRVREQ